MRTCMSFPQTRLVQMPRAPSNLVSLADTEITCRRAEPSGRSQVMGRVSRKQINRTASVGRGKAPPPPPCPLAAPNPSPCGEEHLPDGAGEKTPGGHHRLGVDVPDGGLGSERQAEHARGGRVGGTHKGKRKCHSSSLRTNQLDGKGEQTPGKHTNTRTNAHPRTR